VLTHGWPGSFLEFEQVATLLSSPSAGRGAFHVVVLPVPGYGFSARPTTSAGTSTESRAWCELMARLDYQRFVAAGSDWGISISTSIALQNPDRLIGLHLVHRSSRPTATRSTSPRPSGRRKPSSTSAPAPGRATPRCTRPAPQTVGYALTDSPGGLAAWIGEKLWTWTDQDDAGGLSRDQMLDNLSLYWFTGTAASSARLYWESIAEVSSWFTAGTEHTISVPTGGTAFPKEVPRPSRRWAARRFTNIVHWSEPERGGHFGAWEQPHRFAADVRATLNAIHRS